MNKLNIPEQTISTKQMMGKEEYGKFQIKRLQEKMVSEYAMELDWIVNREVWEENVTFKASVLAGLSDSDTKYTVRGIEYDMRDMTPKEFKKRWIAAGKMIRKGFKKIKGDKE